jgi:hypothetical protein
MKHVRNLLAALLLACALTVNVYAGDQQIPGIVQPPPPPPEPATSLTDSSKTIVTTDADGKIIVATEEPIDYLVDALMAMLSVF